MEVLVTGARGRLGRALEDSLDPDHEVVPLSREDLDIAEIPAVEAALASHSPDWVVNAAAYTDVDGAQDDEEGAQRVNADGPMALALMTARSGSQPARDPKRTTNERKYASPFSFCVLCKPKTFYLFV